MMLEVAIDPLAFDSWVQVAALAVLVLGAIFYKKLDSKAKSTQEDVAKIVSTLTTNNSGSHIKDQLDRIETEQKSQALTLSEHIKWSEEFVSGRFADVEDALEQYSDQ